MVIRVYGSRMSWALFAACDANADDRLDLFEAARGLSEIESARDVRGFRRIDRNSDGFLQWPEFDRRFREAIEINGSLRIQPARAVVEPRDPTVPRSAPDPAEVLVRTHDSDGDARLDPTEFRFLLRRAGLDPALADQLGTLDVDRSGSLTAAELRPVLGALAGALKVVEPRPDTSLPAQFRPADRNLNGVLDREELETALRRLHPTLARWTTKILEDSDLNGNGTLGSAEILRTLRAEQKRRTSAPGSRPSKRDH